jgi:hypothetical protein
MNGLIKNLMIRTLPLIDVIVSPFVYSSGRLLWFVRRIGVQKMKVSRKILLKIGVFPIRDHYYEPLFNPKYLRYSLRKERCLPALDLNVEGQLSLLDKFDYNAELLKIPKEKTTNGQYYYRNGTFGFADAEYYYNIIRLYKPKKIIEIGAGNSTLIAIKATEQNKHENPDYSCEHICIEPYENKWLEGLGIKILRSRVEEIDKNIFDDLDANDILFIDSSHIIKPQGDVLFEILEILPMLKKGVLVHIHDIFTPRDISDDRFYDWVLFWNEQYILEAFLSFNNEYKIIGALNYLKENYFDELSERCPNTRTELNSNPSSFWIMRN